MRVSPITAGIAFHGTSGQQKRKLNRYNMVPITGYAAFGGGIVSAVSGVRHNMVVHRVAAMVALAAAAAHILLLKTMHGLGHNCHKRA